MKTANSLTLFPLINTYRPENRKKTLSARVGEFTAKICKQHKTTLLSLGVTLFSISLFTAGAYFFLHQLAEYGW